LAVPTITRNEEREPAPAFLILLANARSEALNRFAIDDLEPPYGARVAVEIQVITSQTVINRVRALRVLCQFQRRLLLGVRRAVVGRGLSLNRSPKFFVLPRLDVRFVIARCRRDVCFVIARCRLLSTQLREPPFTVPRCFDEPLAAKIRCGNFE